MSPWKDDKITRQVQKQYMEGKDSSWTLESQMKISRMGSWSASIVTNIDIWQRNADPRRRNMKHELVSNATRKGTLPKTVKENSQWRNERSKKNWTMKTRRK